MFSALHPVTIGRAGRSLVLLLLFVYASWLTVHTANWGPDMSCIFCAIVAGTAPAIVVAEDEDCMAFLALGPAAPGHTLVVPRTHAQDIFDISTESLSAVARMSQQVAQLLDERLKPDGMTVMQNNRQAGWQSVFHLHVHVIPRYTGDNLVPPWREMLTDHDDLADIGRTLGAYRQ